MTTTAPAPANAIQPYCLKLLAQRDHSHAELTRKCQTKGFEAAAVETVLADLLERGYLDDARFAENYARQRMAMGYGPLHIRQQLRQHGVELADNAAFFTALAENWQAVLLGVYRKKYGDTPCPNRQEWAKRCRFLQQRGFPLPWIADLPKHLANNLID